MSGRQARTNSGPGSGASTTSNCPGHGDAAASNPTHNDQETTKETMDTDDQDSKTELSLQEVSPRTPPSSGEAIQVESAGGDESEHCKTSKGDDDDGSAYHNDRPPWAYKRAVCGGHCHGFSGSCCQPRRASVPYTASLHGSRLRRSLVLLQPPVAAKTTTPEMVTTTQCKLLAALALVLLCCAMVTTNADYTVDDIRQIVNRRKGLEIIREIVDDLHRQLTTLHKRSECGPALLPGQDCGVGNIAGSGQDHDFINGDVLPGRRRRRSTKEAKRSCHIDAGLNRGCDYKDIMDAVEENKFWKSRDSPGRRRRSIDEKAAKAATSSQATQDAVVRSVQQAAN
ncbi:hypothetical protein MTO96_014882 [Rhipicephalus appendiculatus]